MQLTPKQYKELIASLLYRERKRPHFFWGPPGVGKTEGIHQVVMEANEKEEQKVGLVVMHLVQRDPTDFKLPVPRGQKAYSLTSAELPDEERDGKRGIFFLDEPNQAAQLVQNSASQLIHERRLGEYVLPEGWIVIAAGNKREHGAAVQPLAKPLANRFTHIEVIHDLDDWRAWAINADISADVIGFLSFMPDALYRFSADRDENAFATPRTWEYVSDHLRDRGNLSDEIIQEQIRGSVGEGTAIEFIKYLKIKEQLPDLDEIFAGNDIVPERIDVTYALATALVMRAEPEQFNRVLEYSLELPAEVAVVAVKLLIARDEDAVQAADAWAKWADEHFDLIRS